jgi:hypothetical protein
MNKKSPLFLIISFIILFAVGLGSGYYYSQAMAANNEIDQLEKDITRANNSLEELNQSDIVLAQRSINALEQIEQTEVKWSNVLDTITKIAPTDVEEKRKIVEFISYSGGEDGRLTFNVQTLSSENVERLLGYVADIIKVFDETPDYSNPFVPSISKAQTPEGTTTLSFILSVNYNPSQQE